MRTGYEKNPHGTLSGTKQREENAIFLEAQILTPPVCYGNACSKSSARVEQRNDPGFSNALICKYIIQKKMEQMFGNK